MCNTLKGTFLVLEKRLHFAKNLKKSSLEKWRPERPRTPSKDMAHHWLQPMDRVDPQVSGLDVLAAVVERELRTEKEHIDKEVWMHEEEAQSSNFICWVPSSTLARKRTQYLKIKKQSVAHTYINNTIHAFVGGILLLGTLWTTTFDKSTQQFIEPKTF